MERGEPFGRGAGGERWKGASLSGARVSGEVLVVGMARPEKVLVVRDGKRREMTNETPLQA